MSGHIALWILFLQRVIVPDQWSQWSFFAPRDRSQNALMYTSEKQMLVAGFDNE